jgi:RNA polymerase sigma-70 factor, ECF subfamily
MRSESPDVTALLERFGTGDVQAADELISLLYNDLRRMASYYLRQERRDHTLQATALVNETYLRLVDQKGGRWQNRSQFFGVASQMMRRILVDYARRHRAAKRGGASPQIALEDAFALSKESPREMLALDETLARLASVDPQQAHIVELRILSLRRQ